MNPPGTGAVPLRTTVPFDSLIQVLSVLCTTRFAELVMHDSKRRPSDRPSEPAMGRQISPNLKAMPVPPQFPTCPDVAYHGEGCADEPSECVSGADTLESSVHLQPYRPRGRTMLHEIVNRHYQEFVSHYEQKYRAFISAGAHRGSLLSNVIPSDRSWSTISAALLCLLTAVSASQCPDSRRCSTWRGGAQCRYARVSSLVCLVDSSAFDDVFVHIGDIE